MIYDVVTDLDPQHLNAVGREVFTMWAEFALGMKKLGGKLLHHPTGRYRSSLRYLHFRRSTVMILADTKIAPEAEFIEEGHQPIDMLQHLRAGHVYPMHRHAMVGYVGGGARGRRMWAEARESGFRGFAMTPKPGQPRGDRNSSGTGPAWTVPAMAPYSPAFILAELVRAQYGVAARVTE